MTDVVFPVTAEPGAQLTVNGVAWEWRRGWNLVLHAKDWVTITGRGIVAIIGPEDLPPGPPDGGDLMHKRVLIDGALYAVTGVESCRVNHDGIDKRCPRGYGLLVRPVTDEKP